LRFVNGALGTIAATIGSYPGTGTRIELHGDKGSAVIEDDRLSYLHLAQENREEVGPYGAAREQRAPTAPAGPSAAQNPAALAIRSHALQIEDMIRAIRENGAPLVDGYAAKHPVEIILGIYESARTHQEVTLS
jgi:predicted dehydrogenase